GPPRGARNVRWMVGPRMRHFHAESWPGAGLAREGRCVHTVPGNAATHVLEFDHALPTFPDRGGSVRQSLLTVTLLVLVAAAWMLRDLVMLVGFSALLAYALDPVVSLVERAKLPGRWRVPRGVAAGLVVVALVLVAGAALFEAVPRLVRQLARFA